MKCIHPILICGSGRGGRAFDHMRKCCSFSVFFGFHLCISLIFQIVFLSKCIHPILICSGGGGGRAFVPVDRMRKCRSSSCIPFSLCIVFVLNLFCICIEFVLYLCCILCYTCIISVLYLCCTCIVSHEKVPFLLLHPLFTITFLYCI